MRRVEKQPIAKEVANRLRSLILKGNYKVGEKLPPERKLASSLGVNRATLREALKNLEQTGLVRIRQGDGTRVQDFLETAGLDLLAPLISIGESRGLSILKDILEFRQIIGREIARLAATRVTPDRIERLEKIADQKHTALEEVLIQDLDFYVELSRATGNMVFTLLLNPVRAAVFSFKSFFANLNLSLEEVSEHHQRIIKALYAKDPNAAANAADQHLLRGKERLLSTMRPLAEVMVSDINPGIGNGNKPVSDELSTDGDGS